VQRIDSGPRRTRRARPSDDIESASAAHARRLALFTLTDRLRNRANVWVAGNARCSAQLKPRHPPTQTNMSTPVALADVSMTAEMRLTAPPRTRPDERDGEPAPVMDARMGRFLLSAHNPEERRADPLGPARSYRNSNVRPSRHLEFSVGAMFGFAG